MKRLLLLVLLVLGLALETKAQSLTIEITQGVEGALPIAVVPFAWRGDAERPPPHDVGAIIAADLGRSGRFEPLPTDEMLMRPSRLEEVDFRDWRALNVDNLVIGDLSANGPDGYLVRFYLFDVFRGEQITGYSVPATARDLRAAAHHIADIIYETLTGEPGAFATRIAYVSSVRGDGAAERVELRIADADGYGPQTIVSSKDPIMSPAWSPDGRRIAYVSFENAQPSIWVQEVLTGKRERVSSFKGINGAPAWSPDGRSLAMTLSKDGSPDIYVLDIARRSLRRLTQHWAIDTEPAWSPDGRSIVFTSDRGGSPQIYSVPAAGGEPSRVTFEGDYNARASFSRDGRLMAMVTRIDGKYRIATFDTETRERRVMSNGRLDESPSFAPNGSMIIYATRDGGEGLLAAVSTDGRVQQRLRLQEGDVREPAWSPYPQQQRIAR